MEELLAVDDSANGQGKVYRLGQEKSTAAAATDSADHFATGQAQPG